MSLDSIENQIQVHCIGLVSTEDEFRREEIMESLTYLMEIYREETGVWYKINMPFNQIKLTTERRRLK